jgi:hypothetical protein
LRLTCGGVCPDQSGLRMYGNEVMDFAISGLRWM